MPALCVDRLEVVVFDTDGVLTDTARVHAAAWARLFDDHLERRAARHGEGADVVVADLGELVLDGAVGRRRGR